MATPEDDGPRTRSAFPHHRRMPTRWHDNDHYGHVNNVVYYSYFDTTVNGYLIERTGTDIRELDAIGLVVETGCRYLRPLSFPDELTIGLAVARLGRSSISYRLGVFRGADEEPAALGRFVHVYVDRDERTTIPIPDLIREAVAPLQV